MIFHYTLLSGGLAKSLQYQDSSFVLLLSCNIDKELVSIENKKKNEPEVT